MAHEIRGEQADARERVANENGEVRYRRIFTILADDDKPNLKTLALLDGLPRFGHVHPHDNTCRVVDRSLQQITGHRRLWAMEVQYSNQHEDPDNADEDEDFNVEDEPPELELGFEPRRVAAVGKYDTESMSDVVNAWAGAIKNSAGEPFDPPPEKEDGYPYLRLTRNELSINIPQLMRFQNAVNSNAPYLGAGARCILVNGISGRRQYRKGFRYWRMSYTLTYNPDTWDLQLLDQGRYYIDASDANKIKHFVTDDDPPQPRIGLLDGTGDELGAADAPVFLRFQIYRATDLTLLNLEGSII